MAVATVAAREVDEVAVVAEQIFVAAASEVAVEADTAASDSVCLYGDYIDLHRSLQTRWTHFPN